MSSCNERRKEQGKKPLKKIPKGKLYDPLSCPCGIASGLKVGVGLWASDLDKILARNPHAKLTPECVRQFVHAFDTGKLPQYIA
jgi:hypothetical protein